MANGKVALATSIDQKTEEIKKHVTKKLYGKQHPNLDLKEGVEPTGLTYFLEGLCKTVLIVPAVVVFVLFFIGGGFKIGLEAALEVVGHKRKRGGLK